MSTDLEGAPAPAAARAENRSPRPPPVRGLRGAQGRRLLVLAPWLAVAAVWMWALLWTGVGLDEVALFVAFWVVAVQLPGTLLLRSARGSSSLAEDVGLGAATGLALLLVVWALAVVTQLPVLLWAVPALVQITFVAVPRLRRHWRRSDGEPVPMQWSWAMAAVALAVVWTWAVDGWAHYPLPPAADHVYFLDWFYHLANSAELERTVAPQQPQMAGEPLHYHWFSDAIRAAVHMATGVPLATLILRLEGVAYVVMGSLLIAAVARRVSSAWWSGPVAAGSALLVTQARIWRDIEGFPMFAVWYVSPTLTFSVVPALAATYLCVDVVRGRRLGRAWLLLVAWLALASGVKVSALPVLLAGLVVAGAFVWLRTHRPPRGTLTAIAVVLALLGLVAPVLASGASGSTVQFFSMLAWHGSFAEAFGVPDFVGADGGLFPLVLEQGPVGARALMAAMVALWLLGQVARLVGLGALLHRAIRRDPAAWLLAGVTVGGVAAAFTISHVSNGQAHFYHSAIPAAAVLTSWLLVAVSPQPRPAWWALGGLATGAAVSWAVVTWAPSSGGPAWKDMTVYALVTLVGVVATGSLLWFVARSLVPAVRGRGPAFVLAVLLGLGAYTVLDIGRDVAAIQSGVLPFATGTSDPWHLSVAEMRAAAWVAEHSSSRDVVATNVHCYFPIEPGRCHNRSFWVSGLTERRVVLEGWAHQEATMAEHGRDGLPFYYQTEPPDPARLEVNDRVFTDPTPAAVAELRDTYGVRWLFADERVGEVSPRLDDVAILRHTDGPVRVYEVPPV